MYFLNGLHKQSSHDKKHCVLTIYSLYIYRDKRCLERKFPSLQITLLSTRSQGGQRSFCSSWYVLSHLAEESGGQVSGGPHTALRLSCVVDGQPLQLLHLPAFLLHTISLKHINIRLIGWCYGTYYNLMDALCNGLDRYLFVGASEACSW